METILRGRDPSEVIPFDWSAPVLYYPVRHHSPACAWHLERAIRQYRPELILIEGPENANSLIPILASPDTRAPVALYCSYWDDAGLLRTGEDPAGGDAPRETASCYYPFLDQSPELAALRLAEQLDIPARFMDLPYGEILAAPACGRRRTRSAIPMTDASLRSCYGIGCVNRPGPGASRSFGRNTMSAAASPCPRRNLSGR